MVMLLKPKCFVFPQTFLFVLKIAEATIKIYLHVNVLKVCRNFRFPPPRATRSEKERAVKQNDYQPITVRRWITCKNRRKPCEVLVE